MKTGMLLLLFGFLAMAPFKVQAWTFVGNGGNAGDVELQVALNQIQSTLKLIEGTKTDPELKLCTCYEKYKEQPVCTHLAPLSPTQVEFCANVILTKGPEILKVLSSSDNVRFSWTSENIEVTEKSGPRGAQAVTNQDAKTITINQNSFLAMNPSERVFLIAHELFHLVKLDGKYMADDVEYPNFPGANGGRQLINSLASSILIESYDYGTFQQQRSHIDRSLGNKTHWLSLGGVGANPGVEQKNAFQTDKPAGYKATYRYQFNQWGGLLEYQSTRSSKNILTATTVEEVRQEISLGLTYRYFPFSEPLTFLGQSHFIFAAKAKQTNARLKATDASTAIEQEVSMTSPALAAAYYLPGVNGLWLFFDAEYAMTPLNFEKFNLKYSNNNINMTLGISYGF